MKKIIIVLCLSILAVTSCLKDQILEMAEEARQAQELDNYTFTPDFDWQATTDYVLQVYSYNSTVVKVSGSDTSMIHEGFYDGKDEFYSVDLSLPSHLDNIYVDNNLVYLEGEIIEYSMEQYKTGRKKNIAAGLVSYWTMDEDSGDEIYDEISGNKGLVSGGKWVQGISGSALEFNGEEGLVDIPESPSLVITDAITLSAWVKPYEKKEAKILQKGDWDGYNLGSGKWTGWKGFIYTEDEEGYTVEWDQGIPLLNTWYFLVMTYDESVLKLYVNGVLRAAEAVSGKLKDNGRNVSIGSDNGKQKFFSGVIDEVAVYNVALGEEEIEALYKSLPSSDSDGDGIPDYMDDYDEDFSKAFTSFFPENNGGSIFFEDLWPGMGDYDFNDLVLDYRFTTITNASNYVSEIIGDFTVKAIGGSNRNGFGFQIPVEIPQDSLQVTGGIYTEGYIKNNINGTEAGQSLPTIIVFDNAFSVLNSTGGTGVNVSPDQEYSEPVSVKIIIDPEDGIYKPSDIKLKNFNPFLIVNGDRGREIHLPDYPPSDLANPDYFGTMQDDSDPEGEKYYKSNRNAPWALMLPVSFDYPLEKESISNAYLYFMDWARSSGINYPDWYLDKEGYRKEGYLYSY